MSPKFCCCLPLRLGVLVISFIQFLLCGAVSGFSFWLRSLSDGPDLNDERIAFTVVGAIYLFAAIIGLFGFFGAIFKKNGLVKSYLALLYVTLLLNIAGAVYSVVRYYQTRGKWNVQCEDGNPTAQAGINTCEMLQRMQDTPAWAIWIAAIIPPLVIAYACYVVHNYSRRLTKQHVDREAMATKSGPAYTAVGVSEEAHPLTEPKYQYPYADAANSFGHTNQSSHH